MTRKNNKYYVDGSSPYKKYYPSAYAIFRGDKIIKQKVLEENVNVYEIEFLALLECLAIVKKNCIIFSDSTQVITEVNGKKKPKNTNYFLVAKSLMDEKNIKVLKIGRDENPAGIYLEKRLIKLRKSREEVLRPKNSKKSKKEKARIYSKKK